MPLADVLAALSWKPAAIAGVADRHGRPIEPGSSPTWWSSIPTQRWQVRPAALASRSRNTPYAGRELRGRVRHTVLPGRAGGAGRSAATEMNEHTMRRMIIRRAPLLSFGIGPIGPIAKDRT